MTPPTVIEALSRLLAGTQVLRSKACQFAESSAGSGQMAIADAINRDYALLDELARAMHLRLDALGGALPQDREAIERLSSIKPAGEAVGIDWLAALISDHGQMADDARFVAILIDGRADPSTSGLVLDVIEQHEKCVHRLGTLEPFI